MDKISITPPKRFIAEVEIYGGGSLVYATSPYTFRYVRKETKFGYSFGLGLTHHLNKRIHLSAILSYERKGINSSEHLPSLVTINTDASNDYLTISLLPTLLVKESSPFSVGLGLYVGYLISSKTKVTLDSISGRSFYFEEKTRNSYASYDWGVVVAIKYFFVVKNKTFFIRVVSNSGIASIDRSPYPSATSIDKNNSLVLSIGMKIR
jgi:hypothetical protein